ncbi:TPA: hypothetical protein ACF2D8_002348 [Serratia marcescens]
MKNIVENQGIKTDKPLAMSYEALKAERDAQQKRAGALAVENQALSAALSLISGSYGLSPHIQSMCAVDTPTTDAALAAIQAQGVEKFAEATIAIGEQEEDQGIIYAGKQAMLFAKQLREAKCY